MFLIRFIKSLIHPKKEYYRLLKRITGFYPGDYRIYEMAFIHKSASFTLSDNIVINNERLEYLGDAVLDAIIADYLFTKYPYKDEGFLSQMRAKIVKRKHLNALAVNLGLNDFIIHNTESSPNTKHIYGDAFEALIGAIYIDRGFNMAKYFITKTILKKHVDLDKLLSSEINYKSKIVEWAQKNHKEVEFQSFESYKGTLNSPLFESSVLVDEKCMGKGTGSSKKEAEQNAAKQAIEKNSNEFEEEGT